MALIGLSPAVLTETVFGLYAESEPDIPDRIVVVTTTTGKKRLGDALFTGGGWSMLVHELRRIYGAHIKIPQFGPAEACIRVIPSADQQRDLTDIQTAADNEAAADFMLQLVRSLSDDGRNRIIASIAGGRKSMGALLVGIMSLVGGFGDRIVHVLVDEPWERLPQFYFPSCPGSFQCPLTARRLDSRDARLTLADVPFVPLRYLFTDEVKRAANRYDSLVKVVRNRALDVDSELELNIDLKRGELRINHAMLRLPPAPFAFYAALAKRAALNTGPLEQYLDLAPELGKLARQYLEPDDFAHWSHAVLEAELDPKEQFRKWAADIRQRLKNEGFSTLDIQRLVPQRGRISIEVSPENISFTP